MLAVMNYAPHHVSDAHINYHSELDKWLPVKNKYPPQTDKLGAQQDKVVQRMVRKILVERYF